MGEGGGGVVLPADFLSVLSLTFCSVIGTPPQSDWPANVSLPRSSFPRYPPFSLAELIPEMCESGILLLKVRLSEKMFYRNIMQIGGSGGLLPAVSCCETGLYLAVWE